MSSEQRYHPGADMEGFVHELIAFMDLTEADVAAIRRTAPLILKHEQAITAALYDHFLKFPAAARFFLKDDGTPDVQRLERRKHSLGRWLRETAEVAMTHDFLYYLLAVSISHSHRTHGPGGKITPAMVEKTLKGFIRGEHDPKPKGVSLTNATELGTVYAPSEVKAFSDLIRPRGMKLHMDGARFANALVYSGFTELQRVYRERLVARSAT